MLNSPQVASCSTWSMMKNALVVIAGVVCYLVVSGGGSDVLISRLAPL